MNGFIVIAIVLVVVLAAVALLGAARRRETGAAVGALAPETVKKDKRARKEAAVDADERESGRQVEAAATLARRQSDDIAPVEPKAPVAWTPPDPETFGVTRRQFLNRSVVALMGLGISVFGIAIVGFLYPAGAGGFGSRIRVGTVDDVKDQIDEADGFLYQPEGRMWVTRYPEAALPRAEQVYEPAVLNGMRAGLMALWQTCPHLGCRVPECLSSQWFECPCHGSQYNRVGEARGGPPPRGMDSFAMEVTGGVFFVDTGTIIQGAPLGTNTTGQEAEGPHCIGESDH